MEESNNEKMTYLAIPDEACYIVDIDNNEQFDIYTVQNEATCVVFKDNDGSHFKEIINHISSIKDCKMKAAWFTDKNSIPFRAENFDYVKTKDSLLMNITDSKNPKYYDITNKIITDIKQLDPMAEFYFDMYNEILKNKNENNESKESLEQD